jgi:hypothetical protein
MIFDEAGHIDKMILCEASLLKCYGSLTEFVFCFIMICCMCFRYCLCGGSENFLRSIVEADGSYAQLNSNKSHRKK